MEELQKNAVVLLKTSLHVYHAMYVARKVYKNIKGIFETPMIFFAGILHGVFNDYETTENAKIGNNIRQMLNGAKIICESKQGRGEINIANAIKCGENIYAGSFIMSKSVYHAMRDNNEKFEAQFQAINLLRMKNKILKYPGLHDRILKRFCEGDTIVCNMAKANDTLFGALALGIFSIGEYVGSIIHSIKQNCIPECLQHGIPKIITSSVTCIILLATYAAILGVRCVYDAILALSDVLLFMALGVHDALIKQQHVYGKDNMMVISDMKFDSIWTNIKNIYGNIYYEKVQTYVAKEAFFKKQYKSKSVIMQVLSDKITSQIEVIRREYKKINGNELSDEAKKFKDKVIQIVKALDDKQKQYKENRKKLYRHLVTCKRMLAILLEHERNMLDEDLRVGINSIITNIDNAKNNDMKDSVVVNIDDDMNNDMKDSVVVNIDDDMNNDMKDSVVVNIDDDMNNDMNKHDDILAVQVLVDQKLGNSDNDWSLSKSSNMLSKSLVDNLICQNNGDINVLFDVWKAVTANAQQNERLQAISCLLNEINKTFNKIDACDKKRYNFEKEQNDKLKNYFNVDGGVELYNALKDEYSTHFLVTPLQHIQAFIDTISAVMAGIAYDIAFTTCNILRFGALSSDTPGRSDARLTP